MKIILGINTKVGEALAQLYENRQQEYFTSLCKAKELQNENIVVINCKGEVRIQEKMYEKNILQIEQLLKEIEFIHKKNNIHLIQLSTIGVYGNLRNNIKRIVDINTMPTPQTSYEITKLIGDQVINKAKIKSTILRCGPIIFQNNNNNIISKLIRVAKYKVNIKINTLIYATHILELMEAIDIIEKKKLYGTQIVVNCYDIREIQDLINKKFSLNINVDLINFLIKILNKISFEIVPKKIINYNNKTLYKNSINDNKCVSRVVNDSRK